MKKTVLFCVTLFLFGFSCGDNQNNTLPEELQAEIETKNTSHLTGTEWKLAGYVDVETGKLTVAEPENCESCYTLAFDTDSTAWGISVINEILVDFSSQRLICVVSKVDDSMNGNVQLLYDAMKTADSYRIEKNELKFFYNKNENYLLYKLIQQ